MTTFSVEEPFAQASTGLLVLSRADLWKRMWMSDFIDDTTHREHCDERIKLLEQAALYGHIDSMIELGQYYAMKGDGIEALRWYVLGFEEV